MNTTVQQQQPTTAAAAQATHLLALARAATVKFYNDPTPENGARLDEALVNLNREINSVDPAGRFSASDAQLLDFLSYGPLLLPAAITTASTRSKLMLIFFNFAFYNVPIRRHLAGELQVCGAVFQCLRLSLREQLGPQNMIDILRLLQVLTYEKTLQLGSWTNDLISFLLSEVTQPAEAEWMPYCMAILCNLASRSKSVCARIRKSSSYKAFAQKVLHLLSHDSRIVVVSALVLVGYVEEKLRDLVYCSTNIPKTFQCVFNVLIIGDSLMTRHIAADLLKRLVVSDVPTVSSVPVITSTGKDLISYDYFERSVQQIASLVVHIDPRLEESVKVYDVLLAFLSLPQMRARTARAILNTPPHEGRLTTPLLSVSNTASLSFHEAIDPQVPLKALKLLNALLREMTDSGQRVAELIPGETVLRIIENAVRTPLESQSPLCSAQCQRVTLGLRLAEVVSNDEDLRGELVDVLTAPLCAHIAEGQLMTNPVVIFMAKPPAQRPDKIQDWSIHGVSIVLELLRVLAALKDFSKLHKDQYWKFLKDERLVPFIAYAIAYGNHEMVYDALLLYTHCAQIQAFPSRWLGDLIASCLRNVVEKGDSSNVGSRLPSRTDLRRSSSEHNVSMSEAPMKSPIAMADLPNGESSKHVDELLSRIKNGLDLKEPKWSNIVDVYEKKILLLEGRERELESLLSAKEAALAQSERLRAQLRNQTGDATEVPKLYAIVAELETRVAEANTETEVVRSEKRDAENREKLATRSAQDRLLLLEAQQKECADLREQIAKTHEELMETRRKTKELEDENTKERDLQTVIRRHFDELKNKFDTATMALVEKQRRVEQMEVELNEEKGRRESLERKVDSKEHYQKEMEKEISILRKELSAQTARADAAEKETSKMKSDLAKAAKFKEEMLKMASNF